MPRPKTLRCIDHIPDVTWFKPAGIRLRDLQEVKITFDEVEAMRLADYKGLYQEDIAVSMNISRQTVGRILSEARKKIVEALIEGKAIRLEGGSISFPSDASNCHTEKK